MEISKSNITTSVDLSVGDLVEIKRQEEAVSKFYIVSEF